METEKIYLFGTLLLSVIIIVLGIVYADETAGLYGAWVIISILILNAPLLYMIFRHSKKE
jgi:hypothetical protein